MSEFRVVVVGCGSMASAWVEGARKVPGVSIVGLVDLNRANAEALADKHGFPYDLVETDLSTVVRRSNANVVFDVTIPEAHEQVTADALRLGCHVLGEKPLTPTVASAKRLLDEANKAGKLFAVMQNRRYDANLVSYADVVHTVLGGPEELHADMFIGAHFGGFRDAMDFPLLIDMAIHTFDAARYISRADPVSVYCHSFNPKRSWYKGDASAVCVFEMTDGIVFSYRGSWCSEGLHADWNGVWRTVGPKGTATWDGKRELKAQVVKPDGKPGFHFEMQDVPITPAPLPASGHAGLIADFFACLRDGRTPQTIATDNIKSLAMVEAAVKSAKTGTKVKVEW